MIEFIIIGMVDVLVKETLVFTKWFRRRAEVNLAGLEIGTDSLKLLRIVSANSHATVENFATTPLPPNAIVKEEIKDSGAVTSSLKMLVKEADIQTNQVALSIPRSSVIIKNTTVDKRLTSSEIDSRAWIEANRHFPDLVGEIYLDYTIVGPSSSDPNQLELMLVACRKEQIKPYLDLLKQAGLVAKIVDVDSYALERALMKSINKEEAAETIGLINLGLTLSTFIVIQKNILIYAHDHTYDGHRLVKQVNEYAKTQNTQIEEKAYYDLLKENLSSHLRHTLHFFYSSRPNIAIQKLYLSGDAAVLPNLHSFLQKEISVPCELVNPFLNMQINPNINANLLKAAAPTLMLCCGLALSKIQE